VLASVKDKPFGRPPTGAVLDRRCARWPHHRAGRDERMAPPGAEQKNDTRQESKKPSDQIPWSQALNRPPNRGKSSLWLVGHTTDGEAQTCRAFKVEFEKAKEALASLGANRYWEGRWRDEVVIVERTEAALEITRRRIGELEKSIDNWIVNFTDMRTRAERFEAGLAQYKGDYQYNDADIDDVRNDLIEKSKKIEAANIIERSAIGLKSARRS
jgi:hypothetical protein